MTLDTDSVIDQRRITSKKKTMDTVNSEWGVDNQDGRFVSDKHTSVYLCKQNKKNKKKHDKI